jgi:hypothetical protein
MTPDEVDAVMLGTHQFVVTLNPNKRYEWLTGYVESSRILPWTAEQTIILVTFD